jgi:recombination protein RecT
MQIIDWVKVHELAQKPLAEFLESTKSMGKVDELPSIQKFSTYMDRYEKQVLPSLLQNMQITPAKFVTIVINEVKKNDKLLAAFTENPSSMFASILAGAEIGLVPSDLLGEFYLIPRNIKQSNGNYAKSITPLIGYKGLVKLLLRSGDIQSIDAQVVYEGDKFSVTYGLEPKLVHKPNFDADRTAEKITHIYAVAHLKTGKPQFSVMTRDELIAIRDMSKYENDLYFNDKKNPNRWMEKKSCLIQLSKLLDKDYYGQKAIELDNKLNGGALLTLDNNDQIQIIESTPVKPTRFRNIYGTLNSINK